MICLTEAYELFSVHGNGLAARCKKISLMTAIFQKL